MTYGITVKSQGGKLEISGSYGDIPDGEHEITGHEGHPVQVSGGTTQDHNIQVVRRNAAGRKVIAAQHYDNDVLTGEYLRG